MEYMRHGDVLIVPTKEIKKTFKKQKDKVLLEGEVTGHFHRLHKAEVWRNHAPKQEDLYWLGEIEVSEEDKLTHEEHQAITLKPGLYRFYGQREYDPVSEHMVRD